MLLLWVIISFMWFFTRHTLLAHTIARLRLDLLLSEALARPGLLFILITGALAVRALLFDDELLARVGMNLLHEEVLLLRWLKLLLGLILLESLLRLVARQLGIGRSFRQNGAALSLTVRSGLTDGRVDLLLLLRGLVSLDRVLVFGLRLILLGLGRLGIVRLLTVIGGELVFVLHEGVIVCRLLVLLGTDRSHHIGSFACARVKLIDLLFLLVQALVWLRLGILLRRLRLILVIQDRLCITFKEVQDLHMFDLLEVA